MKFLIYDPALNSAYTLVILQKYYGMNAPLFRGTKDEALAYTGPWLFQIDNELGKNLSKEWEISLRACLVLESAKDIGALSAHLKPFIHQIISGREYFFRFWDGRVLKKFLPTCDRRQLTDFFGPVERFLMEEENGEEAIEFRLRHGVLEQQKTGVEELFGQAGKNFRMG